MKGLKIFLIVFGSFIAIVVFFVVGSLMMAPKNEETPEEVEEPAAPATRDRLRDRIDR